MLVVAAGFLLQLWLRHHHGLYAISADESGRTLLAYRWMRGQSSMVTTWLPFYTVVVGTALGWQPDLFTTPRLVSSLFGALALGALLWLAQELFRRRAITVATGVLALLFAPLVTLSVVPLAEIMFISVVVAASACSIRAARTGSTTAHWLGILCLAVATTVRYEGWVWVAAYVLCTALPELWRRHLDVRTAGATLVLLAFPAGWVVAHTFINGHPLGFVSQPGERYLLLQGESWLRLLWNSVGAQFLQQNLSTLNLLGVGPLILLSWRDPGVRRAAMPPAVALLMMSGLSMAGSMPSHNFWRIAVPWSVLLLPFTAYLVVALTEALHLAPVWRRVALVTALAILGAVALAPIRPFLRRPAFSQDDLHAGQFVRQRLLSHASEADSPQILIDTSRWSYLNVVIAAQDPELFVHNTGADPLQPQPAIVSAAQIDERALAGRRVTHLLLQQRSLKVQVEQDGGFRKVADFGSWSLYEVGRLLHGT